MKDKEPIGLYGLIDRGVDRQTGKRMGEGFLTTFPDFRFRVIGKAFLANILSNPFKDDFEEVYTWTCLPKLAKLFDCFIPLLGLRRLDTLPPWDNDPKKIWFVKEREV